jgi:hypothetical protein
LLGLRSKPRASPFGARTRHLVLCTLLSLDQLVWASPLILLNPYSSCRIIDNSIKLQRFRCEPVQPLSPLVSYISGISRGRESDNVYTTVCRWPLWYSRICDFVGLCNVQRAMMMCSCAVVHTCPVPLLIPSFSFIHHLVVTHCCHCPEVSHGCLHIMKLPRPWLSLIPPSSGLLSCSCRPKRLWRLVQTSINDPGQGRFYSLLLYLSAPLNHNT